MDLLQKPFVDMFFEIFSTNESIIWGLVVLFYSTVGVYTAKRISTFISKTSTYSDGDAPVEIVAIFAFLFSPLVVFGFSFYYLGYFLTSKESKEIEKEHRSKEKCT